MYPNLFSHRFLEAPSKSLLQLIKAQLDYTSYCFWFKLSCHTLVNFSWKRSKAIMTVPIAGRGD
jgi:hypothetical protein